MHLYINTTAAPKERINLAELAEVEAKAPAEVLDAAPLHVAEQRLYALAFDKPSLLEEVRYVYRRTAARRAQPAMYAQRGEASTCQPA